MNEGEQNTQTADASRSENPRAARMRPVLVAAHGVGEVGAVYSVGAAGLTLGRAADADLVIDDAKVSRRHAHVRMRGGLWFVEDLGSRNGTYVDGIRIEKKWRGIPSAIRVGHGVLVPTVDAGALATIAPPAGDKVIAGFLLREAWRRIDEAAKIGTPLHLHGDSGCGKELAARRFHDASQQSTGEFVAVNCAAIPEELAERLLFGAVRGAYSGAVATAVGFIQAAARGTLFLDEIAELPMAVQAKLLRVLEDHEVTPLGATRPIRVAFRLVSATNVQLSEAVARCRFRADLYYRIAGQVVVLPSLRQRCEEIALHVESVLTEVEAPAATSAAFIEACLLRSWEGNIRQLRAEIVHALTEARLRGANELRATDLKPPMSSRALATDDPLADKKTVEAALERCGGNVSACARELRVHRTQLRRWLKRHAVAPRTTRDSSDEASG